MAETRLASVLSDPPVEVEGTGGTPEAGWAGRWVDTEVRLCPDSCCTGQIPLRAASQEREGSTRAGEGEDSVGCREEGAGKSAGWAWTGDREGKMKQGPPCDRRDHGGEEGGFGAETGACDGDLLSTGGLSSGWDLCAEEKE